MIAVEVGNENMINALETDLETSQLDLRGFPAIDQKKPLSHIKQLSGWISFGSWRS
jgi:hypothetical protein